MNSPYSPGDDAGVALPGPMTPLSLHIDPVSVYETFGLDELHREAQDDLAEQTRAIDDQIFRDHATIAQRAERERLLAVLADDDGSTSVRRCVTYSR